MRLFDRLRSDPARDGAHALYLVLMEQARRPEFYLDAGVPDSLDGRFDMLVLHAFLVMRRLRGTGRKGRGVSQGLYDVMFADLDRTFREMGVGDFGIGHKINRMSKAYMGRVKAYEEALAAPQDGPLRDALLRNLFRGLEPAAENLDRMVDYVRRADRELAGRPTGSLLAGELEFAAPPNSKSPNFKPPNSKPA